MVAVEVRSSLLNRTLRGGLRPDLASRPLPSDPQERAYVERLQEPLRQGAFVDSWNVGLSTGEMSALTAPWLAATVASVATLGLTSMATIPWLAAQTNLGFLPSLGVLFGGIAAGSVVGAAVGAGAYAVTACLTHSILRHRREQAAEKALQARLPNPNERAEVVRAALDHPGSLAGGLLGMALGPFTTGPSGSAFAHNDLTSDQWRKRLGAAASFPFLTTVGLGFGMFFSPITGYMLGHSEGVRPQLATAAGVAAGIGLGVSATLAAGGHPVLAGLAGWLGGSLGGSVASAAWSPLVNPDVSLVRSWQAELGSSTEGRENLIRLATGLEMTGEEHAGANRLLKSLSREERGLLLKTVADDPRVGASMLEWDGAHRANPELARLEPWRKALGKTDLTLSSPHVSQAIWALCHVPEATALVRDLKDEDRGRLLAHLASSWVDDHAARAQIRDIARSWLLGAGKLVLQQGPARAVAETETRVTVGGVSVRRRAPARLSAQEALQQMEKDAPVHFMQAETGTRALDQLAPENEAARLALVGVRVGQSEHFKASLCKLALQSLERGEESPYRMARHLAEDTSFYYSREGHEALFAMLSLLQQQSGPEGAELLDRTLDKLDGQLGKNALADQKLVTGALDKLVGLTTDREALTRMRSNLVEPEGAALKESGNRLIVGGVAVKIRRPS
ncbi:MAG: hypothetical protein AMXMBFR33_16320 [Candidatus Xenobia bacterium]